MRVRRGIEKNYLLIDANIGGREVSGTHCDMVPDIGRDLGVCKFIKKCDFFGFEGSFNWDVHGRFWNDRSRVPRVRVPSYNILGSI